MGQIKQATGKLLSKLEFVDEIWKKADFKDKWLNTFGKELLQEYKDYKANRPPCPQELLEQIPLVKQFLTSLNITYYEDERYEADDIAGNIAKKASNLNYDVKIYTSDKDYLQLIDNKITVNLIKKGLKDIHEMTEETFKNERGFLPAQIVDYKGLMGDPSDNLKGIPKVGEVTAKKLIIQYEKLTFATNIN